MLGTRFCVYCPEEYDTAEVKECIENMYKKIYSLQADKDSLLEDLSRIQKAYKEATGKEYVKHEGNVNSGDSISG